MLTGRLRTADVKWEIPMRAQDGKPFKGERQSILNRMEVIKMKRTGLFFSCFLLLGIALVAGAANNAFAARGTPPVPQTAILVCQVSGTGIIVSDYSNTSSVVISASEDCAAALAALEGAGLGIRNVQSLNSFPI